ncbi:MAG: beta-ketoacyl synthase chain length factor [Lentimicrobiaceae bacterium]|nr:beta-ketoacyl synthase chain length factor [Lentimicrobiaceae bacterium]
MNNIYINSIKQISVQQPLVDDWFEQPVFYSENYVRAIEPDYKQFFTPNEARRLGKILKRALLVSRQAMAESSVVNPGAIITGTGLGCIESTEIFLDKLVRDGEEFLNPTHFMQSTHNTIGSLIAIDTKCHSYNSTYAHKGISFECALQDAFLQILSRKIQTALVGAHDEMTPAYFTLLKKAGYFGNQKQTFAGETAVAMMLSTEKTEKTVCKIEAVEKIYGDLRLTDMRLSEIEKSEIGNLNYIMVGINGNPETDKIYFENCAKLFPNIPLLQYKNMFGESYTAPALGVYAAAICLQKGEIPDFLMCDYPICDMRHPISNDRVSKILCYNHFENKNHTFILLSK